MLGLVVRWRRCVWLDPVARFFRAGPVRAFVGVKTDRLTRVRRLYYYILFCYIWSQRDYKGVFLSMVMTIVNAQV